MNQTRTQVSVGLLGVTFYWGQAPISAQAILRFPSFDLPAFVTIVYFVTAANKRIISKHLFFFFFFLKVRLAPPRREEKSLHTQITCRMCNKPCDLSPSWLTNFRKRKTVCCLLTSLFLLLFRSPFLDHLIFTTGKMPLVLLNSAMFLMQ